MQKPNGGEMGAEATFGETARREWQNTAEDVAGKAADLAADAERSARRIADEASQKLRFAKEKAAAAYNRTADSAERAFRGARGYATENPGTAAAMTFAAGLGLGMMLAPRSGFRGYQRGLIPVVAVALAHAVIDVFDEAR